MTFCEDFSHLLDSLDPVDMRSKLVSLSNLRMELNPESPEMSLKFRFEVRTGIGNGMELLLAKLVVLPPF